MRISDWSSDVCSSDLALWRLPLDLAPHRRKGQTAGDLLFSSLGAGSRPAALRGGLLPFTLSALREPGRDGEPAARRPAGLPLGPDGPRVDRKSTRLNSSH